MTFEELVKKVAKDNGVSETKTAAIVKQALHEAAQAALNDNKAPIFTGIGRFVAKPMRTSGRKTDGTQWTAPPRVKLGISTTLSKPITVSV